MKNFAKLAEPLYHLVGGRPPRGRKTPPFLWTECNQEAFECLISCLTSPPILGYPDFQLPFTVHVDASSTGLGAALYQTQKGRPTVIAYGSRTLSPADRNYSAYRREFLALKWAVAEKFRDYLYGFRFHVITDSNHLTYLVTSAKLSPADHRSLPSLVVFDFEISYHYGTHESFLAMCQAYSVDALGDELAELPAVEIVGARPEAVDNDLPADPPSSQPWHMNLVHNWAKL